MYVFLDWLLEIHVQPFIYVGFIAFSFIAFFLNRVGRTQAAKTAGLLGFNSMIHVVAVGEGTRFTLELPHQGI